MTDDLVIDLRLNAEHQLLVIEDYRRAADRIEKLEAALRKIAEANSVQAGPDKDMYRRWRRVATNAIDIARKALENSNG